MTAVDSHGGSVGKGGQAGEENLEGWSEMCLLVWLNGLRATYNPLNHGEVVGFVKRRVLV